MRFFLAPLIIILTYFPSYADECKDMKDFIPGTIIDSKELNCNFHLLLRQLNDLKNEIESYKESLPNIIPPIGSIIAWHRDFKEPFSLPENWVECNGDKIHDKESPFHNLYTPPLNKGNAYKGGRFLRGGEKSGEMQEGSLHFNESGDSTVADHSDWMLRTDGASEKRTIKNLKFGYQYNTRSVKYDVSRPVNMSVIWIMRIK